MLDDDAVDAPPAPTSMRGTLAWRLKSIYVAIMRFIGRVLVKCRLLPAEPPSRSHRIKHWLVSLTKIHDSLAIAELDVPWWTYRSIDVVENWLRSQTHPIRLFEYGSGASTFWLAHRVDELYTVEHHAEFASLVGPELAGLDNVTFFEVPAPTSKRPRVRSEKTGSQNLDFYDYVHLIESIEGDFDVVVIDGRAREECLRVARKRLRPGGIIVFDNTHRARYRAAIAESGMAEESYSGLTPTLPYPDRTSVLREPETPASDGASGPAAG